MLNFSAFSFFFSLLFFLLFFLLLLGFFCCVHCIFQTIQCIQQICFKGERKPTTTHSFYLNLRSKGDLAVSCPPVIGGSGKNPVIEPFKVSFW